jgi:mycothiol synthase
MEQLRMIRGDAPVVLPAIPAGYHMRAFAEGDEEDWCRCCIDGALGVSEISTAQFERSMKADSRVDTRNIDLMYGERGVAGTATYQFGHVPGEAYLHMVAIAREHRGKGLSRCLTLYVIDKILRAGNDTIILTTDDWRLAAIKTYINCGFAPCITDKVSKDRWGAVLGKYMSAIAKSFM